MHEAGTTSSFLFQKGEVGPKLIQLVSDKDRIWTPRVLLKNLALNRCAILPTFKKCRYLTIFIVGKNGAKWKQLFTACGSIN